ncbi:hypothetical protein ACFVY0_11795 [Streptomyces sp. NPDC058286]|uniref:hypothetical protein n=1 Tax=Streptomyces sp. NPDC058286 TaxID=3346422 RepID=UPI0036E5ED02
MACALYSTGTFDRWKDDRSLDHACDGTLAQGGLRAALHSSHLSAGSEGDSEYLASCSVRNAETGPQRSSLDVRLRWSSAAPPSADLAWYNEDYNGVRGQAAPLGHGWSGIARYQGGWQVMVALDCRNQKDKALVASGDLHGEPNSATLAGLGQVTTETAQKAAEKHGCQVKAGKRLTSVSLSRLGTPDTAKPLKQAQGSCASLRRLAPTAAENGVPEVMEYPADAQTPQVNCYLATPEKKPGYGLYAYYGGAAKDFLASEGDNLKKGRGPTYGDKEYAWATARCPESAQPAVFVLYHLYDRDTDTYPVAHHSAQFAASALKAFAGHEAKLRGCSDVQMTSRP